MCRAHIRSWNALILPFPHAHFVDPGTEKKQNENHRQSSIGSLRTSTLTHMRFRFAADARREYEFHECEKLHECSIYTIRGQQFEWERDSENGRRWIDSAESIRFDSFRIQFLFVEFIVHFFRSCCYCCDHGWTNGIANKSHRRVQIDNQPLDADDWNAFECNVRGHCVCRRFLCEIATQKINWKRTQKNRRQVFESSGRPPPLGTFSMRQWHRRKIGIDQTK